MDVFIVDASTYDEVQQQLLKFRDNIKIVNTYKPNSEPAAVGGELDAARKANSTENGVSGGANGAKVGGTSNQSCGSGPPAVSVVTFSTELEYLGGIEDPQVEETTVGFAIVINGHSLVHCLHPQMERLFLDVVMQCKAVICCRVTPLQKALVVELVKKSKHAVTLAIGDGANDVSMIKAAHIGVGISGEEGMQAVLASDYSIAQFRFLERLLLVHGRWSYYRMCSFLRYFFNKNFAFTLCHFWYAFFCGFSAQTVFDPMYISVYNLFYTSLPVLAVGIFDQDVNDKNSIQYPQLYKPGHMNLFFNKKEFFRSALSGCFVSIILCFIAYGTYNDAATPNGQGLSDYMLFCSATAAILVIVNTAQIAMDTQYWTVFNHIMIWGSLAFYFVADNFYNYVFNGPYVGSLTKAMGSANFWFATVLIVIMCVLPVLAYRFYFVDVFPTLSDRVRLKQRLAQVRSRQSQDVLRTPSARRARRSIRSGYAFAHQEGFGRLITSGKIMRKLPNAEFTIPNIMNKLNMSNSTKESNRNPPNTAATQEGSSGSSGGRAPIQDLDTINL
ncbi:probable phospholipid-transporting ATPase IM isoform X2 [Dendroctonus ponderosae]|uniref:probable phospholipid-transporting ATPase IM isoform X2 n=1 Tax=Dendroctonus ponderosae TaxID=77166 RepID=UPI002034F98D|nr:probable phospholipid-transporting ATPase IM isoform X2 [Dendroctonus ponderosae]